MANSVNNTLKSVFPDYANLEATVSGSFQHKLHELSLYVYHIFTANLIFLFECVYTCVCVCVRARLEVRATLYCLK